MPLLPRFALLGLLAGSTPVLSQPLAQALPQFDKDAEALLERYKIPAAAIAVVEKGKVVYLKTHGVTSRKDPKPVDEHTVFRLASVSKTFAAVLAGQAVYERRLSLKDPVSRYVPGFHLKYDRQNKLNLEHVLSHQSGLPHHAYDDQLEAGQPFPVLLRRIQTLDPACVVGRCYAYQNIMYSTIGNALEKSSGQSYEDLLQARLFNPLGMRDSGASLAHFQASTNAALPHIKTSRGWWPKAVEQPYYEVKPAAGVNASIHDMSQYLIAVMGHRPDVIPPAVMDELTTPRVATPKEGLTSKWRKTRVKNPKYGLGWRVFQYNGKEEMIFHAGGQFGVSTMIGFLPGRDIGMVMMWNASESKPATLMPTLFDRALDLPKVDYLETPKPVSKTATKKKAKRSSKASAKKASSKKPTAKKTSTKKASTKKKSSAQRGSIIKTPTKSKKPTTTQGTR